MLKKKINIDYKFFIIVLSFFLLLNFCGSPSTKEDKKNFYDYYKLSNFGPAYDAVSEVYDNARNQDKYLVLLERAKIALAAGFYSEAIKDFQLAEKEFMDIEGTFSITEEATALWLNDTMKDYKADVHEQLLINPYIALAYLEKGQFDEAIVERNRSLVRINQYLENNENLKHYENPFARYLVGLLYEMEDEYDEAIIEYKKILNNFPDLAHIKKDIYAIEEKDSTPIKNIAKIEEEAEKTGEDVEIVENAELIVFFEVGRIPIKISNDYKHFHDDIWLSASYAEYKVNETPIDTITLNLDGYTYDSKELYNLEDSVLTNYENKKDEIQSKVVAKAILQGATQAVGSAMMDSDNEVLAGAGFILNLGGKVSAIADKADTRSWTTLPKEFRYIRIRDIEPKDYYGRIEIALSGSKTILRKELDLSFIEGQKKFYIIAFRISFID